MTKPNKNLPTKKKHILLTAWSKSINAKKTHNKPPMDYFVKIDVWNFIFPTCS